MNKVLFIDVDGTLISFTSHKVPDSSIDALQKARENGCEIIIATGRAYTDLEDLKEIPYNAVIALNGSDCVLRDGTSIARRQIPLDDFRKALALSEEYGFPIAVENDLGIFVNRRDPQVIALAEHVNHPVPPVVDIEKMFVESKCCQLCFYCDKETENEIMRQLPHLSASRWHPIFADINVKGVVITSSPGPIPAASKAICSALAPLEQDMQCFTPISSANSASNCWVCGPSSHWLESNASKAAW